MKKKEIIKIRKDNFFYKTVLSVKIFLEKKIINNPRNLLFSLLFSVFVLYASIKLKPLFFISILTLVGSVSMFYIRYVPELYVIGVEFCMMATVLCGKAYGSAIGAAVAVTSITTAFIIGGRLKHTYFISIIVLAFIGLIVPYFNFNITTLGIIMTLIFDAITIPIYIWTGSRLGSSIIFLFGHLFFNYWVFTTIAPIIFDLMI